MTIAIQIKDLAAATSVAAGDAIPIQRASDSKVVKATPLQLGLVQAVTVPLTSAQIKDLQSTPVTILAAPGAGKMIAPVEVALNYTYGTVAYQIGIGVRAFLLLVGTVQAASIAQTFITNTENRYYQTAASINGGRDGMVNAALTISSFGSPPTTGDGTMTATVYYMIVTA